MDWINFDLEDKKEDKDGIKDEQPGESNQAKNVIWLNKDSFISHI